MVNAAGSRRRGASTLGCLVSLVLVAVVVYYGLDFGKALWNYYKLGDEMQTSAQFARDKTDDAVLNQLRNVADRLQLPPEARQFRIRREGHPPTITITTEYSVTISLPFGDKVLHFRPFAQATSFQ
jgi:hypothetical protein